MTMYHVLHLRDRGSNGGDMLEVEVAVERQMILLGRRVCVGYWRGEITLVV